MQITDEDRKHQIGLPPDLVFRSKGQLALNVYADGLVFDFICGDEVYGNCTELRRFLEDHEQAYVLRVAANVQIELMAGTKQTCAQAVHQLITDRQWEVRSAGKGSKGDRWYAWALIGTASPATSCWSAATYAQVSWRCTTATSRRAAGHHQPADPRRRAALASRGVLRVQARTTSASTSARPRVHTAIVQYTVLVMAALAICAVAAAHLRRRTDGQPPPPTTPTRPHPPTRA